MSRRSLVIGTAGHIDHGKSALVKALTGTDPDRLKEEQERGITIDLGFAHTVVDDVAVAFVDVPGHERFVRNMLAGAGGFDAVVLVVAADESVMPQTREHFEICRLLGIERGVIALTKSDVADADTIELAALEVRELVAQSFLANAAVIPVSARTGAGLDALRRALAALADAQPRRSQEQRVRLPVDRVFTVKGFGTVVTGTLVSGRVRDGDELAALPEGRTVRVRGIQVHGRPTPATDAPRRVALNLGAIEVAELSRGVTLASGGSLAVTRRFDARVELVSGARPLRHGARVRVHQGTSELAGRIAIGARRATLADAWSAPRIGEAAVVVPAGGHGYVRIRLDRAAVLTRFDRFVLRALSPPTTIGGGVVLDPEPPPSGLRRSETLHRFETLDIRSDTSDDPDVRCAALWLHEASFNGIRCVDLVRRGGLDPERAAAVVNALVASGQAMLAGSRVFASAAATALDGHVLRELSAFHRAHPFESGIPREALREGVARKARTELFDAVIASLAARGVLGGTDRLALGTHRPTIGAEDERASAVLERVLREAGLTPPDVAGLAAAVGVPPETIERLVHRQVRERRLVRLDALVFHRDALAAFRADVQALKVNVALGTDVQIDVGAIKERYGLSRKYAIPLLEWLDRERVTRRMGGRRVVL